MSNTRRSERAVISSALSIDTLIIIPLHTAKLPSSMFHAGVIVSLLLSLFTLEGRDMIDALCTPYNLRYVYTRTRVRNVPAATSDPRLPRLSSEAA